MLLRKQFKQNSVSTELTVQFLLMHTMVTYSIVSLEAHADKDQSQYDFQLVSQRFKCKK